MYEINEGRIGRQEGIVMDSNIDAWKRAEVPDITVRFGKPTASDSEIENQQAIHTALETTGVVRFRVELRIYRLRPDGNRSEGQYSSLRGESATIRCRTKDAVDYVRVRIPELLKDLDQLQVWPAPPATEDRDAKTT